MILNTQYKLFFFINIVSTLPRSYEYYTICVESGRFTIFLSPFFHRIMYFVRDCITYALKTVLL